MAFILNSTNIRRPNSMKEDNDTQTAENRALSGTVARDLFGSNKRVWTLEHEHVNPTDYATIQTIYQSYLSTKAAKTWQVTEGNYVVAQTNVHVDLKVRSFTVQGSSYLSDFTLILKEA